MENENKTKMIEGLKQGFVVNNKNPLVLLVNENGMPKDRVGHFGIMGGEKLWMPYTVMGGVESNFFSRSCIAIAGKKSINDIVSAISEGKDMPFALVNGYFPRGCGQTIYDPRLVIMGEEGKFGKDIVQYMEDTMSYDADLDLVADGKLKLVTLEAPYKGSVLHVNDFSESYFKNLDAYAETMASLIESYVAPKGTAILFHANLGKSKKISLS